MLTLNDGRSELWQWDTGRTLAVDADCSQVHFSNKVFGRSIDVDVADGVAIIPDVLLQTDKDLNVWAFVGTAENGYTKISKTFKVNRRNKPADYVFTPPDQTSIEEIKEKIDYLESIQDPDAIKNAVEDYLEQNQVVTAALQSKADAESLNSWAFRELFSPEDLDDPENRNSIIEIDGVEYYRYHASGNNFTWTNPRPRVGSVTITARGVSQYGGTGSARLLTFYDDGTSGPYLVVVANGEPQTVTVTTEAGKTLAKITGNYDLENWVLLDLSVMSVKQDADASLPFASADAAGGVKAEPAETSDTVPARLGKDGRLYVTPSGTVSGDYIPVPATASVGQTIKVSAVDEDGNPTAWEAADFPSGGGGTSGDYIPIPASSEVGQTIVVKAVDENGKPTEWEAVDMTGGGLKLAAKITTTENVASISIAGLSLRLPVSIRVNCPGTAENTGNGMCLTLNGIRKNAFPGTQYRQGNKLLCIWLYEADGKTKAVYRTTNSDGFGLVELPTWDFVPETIDSIELTSAYNDGTSRYYVSGTVVEVYEGVHPNV